MDLELEVADPSLRWVDLRRPRYSGGLPRRHRARCRGRAGMTGPDRRDADLHQAGE